MADSKTDNQKETHTEVQVPNLTVPELIAIPINCPCCNALLTLNILPDKPDPAQIPMPLAPSIH